MIATTVPLAATLLLATAALAAKLPAAGTSRDLPPECADFTAGLCNPNADELIETYPLPNGPSANAVCQDVCKTIEGCHYFTYNSEKETCYLFEYRYLDSCEVIGGLAAPVLDICHVEIEDSCTSFKREDCTYNGNVVFNRTSVANAHACQQLLGTIGYLYGGAYFAYDRIHHTCVFYDSKEAACVAFSGPRTPDMSDCGMN
jgi:hypothetical protein